MEIFGFMPMSLIDILDILMVATIIYLLLRWMRGTPAMSILIAVFLLLFCRLVVTSLGMKLMSAIVGTLIDVGVLALIIIFQPEIRRFLIRLGSDNALVGKGRNFISRFFGEREERIAAPQIAEIAQACEDMSEDMVGALIVIPHKTPLKYIIDTGDVIDADIRCRLIENIFFKNSPLHDGAMVISGNKIVAARCTLPITNRTDIPASYGMRHKAAIGISEESDAEVIVVSEQTGHISYVREGVIRKLKNAKELKLILSSTLNEAGDTDNGEKKA